MVGFMVFNSQSSKESQIVQALAAGLGTIISNVGLLTCGMIIFIYKIRNIVLSRKLGWSEDRYYEAIGKHKNWWALYVRERANQKNKKNSAE